MNGAGNPPTQLRPLGLMGFLEIKRGQAPSQLLDSISADLDLRRWYLETNSETITMAVGAALATGNVSFPDFVVPALEWWHVSGFTGAIAGLGAGEILSNMQLAAIVAPSGVPFPLTVPRTITGTAGTGSHQVGVVPLDLWLPPNSGLIVNMQELTGAATFQGSARITRLVI